MKSPAFLPTRIGTLMLTVLTLASCDGPDTLPPIVEELAKKQAAQQESLTKQSQQLSEASKSLVESDAKARRDLTELQSTVQTHIESQRQVVQEQRDGLEEERRAIASQRHRDPLIATALVQAATVIVAALPILLLILILRSQRNEPSDVPLAEMLITDLTSERPLLLPAPLLERPAMLLPPPSNPALPHGVELTEAENNSASFESPKS